MLDEKASHRLLLSKYALTASAFSDENSCAWGSSLVRGWLNGTFLETAFSDDQRNAIQQTGVANPKNEEYGTSGGVATIDYVFLLSIDEAEQYFENEGERLCLPTQAALNDGVRIRKDTGCCSWLLRSPGMSQGKGNGVTEGETAFSAYVGNDGFVYPSGYPVTLADSGIRPALWV